MAFISKQQAVKLLHDSGFKLGNKNGLPTICRDGRTMLLGTPAVFQGITEGTIKKWIEAFNAGYQSLGDQYLAGVADKLRGMEGK